MPAIGETYICVTKEKGSLARAFYYIGLPYAILFYGDRNDHGHPLACFYFPVTVRRILIKLCQTISLVLQIVKYEGLLRCIIQRLRADNEALPIERMQCAKVYFSEK
ncbi:MAG: hypothetical protein UY07_C0045G0020 [Parcubacteria group bacterium GW2011_GWA1_47_8]|nr:MAG: hypothetical protein UY07_C0045G0020 [Parcubacteria group bacterium GW2011_GWA1_47_8]